MIVIDGPDHVGKTVLAHKLVEALNTRGMPHVYQHLGKLPECFHYLRDYIPLIQKNVVMDRFHMSRVAYGTVFDNQRILDKWEYSLLDSLITLKGGIVIVVTAKEEILRERFGSKDELYEIEGVMKVNEIYQHIASHDEAKVDYWFQMTDKFPGEDPLFIEKVVARYVVQRKVIQEHIDGIA